MSLKLRTVGLLVGLALVAAAVAGSAPARPPPDPVCAVCAATEERDSVGGVPVSVTSSELVIRVDGTGNGHWTAAVTVNKRAANRLAANDSLRQQFVAAALEANPAADPRRNVSSHVEGRTLVVEYDVHGMGHRTVGGVLLIDYFYQPNEPGAWHRLAADRVVLVGPQDTTATRAPPGSQTRQNRVSWTREGDADDWVIIEGREHIVFGPDDGVAGTATTVAAVQIDVLQASAADLPTVAALPVALLTLVVGLLAVRGAWLRHGSRRVRAGRAATVTALAAIGSILLPVALAELSPGDAVLAWLFALGVGGGALLLPVALVEVAIQVALTTGWRPWNPNESSPRGRRSVRDGVVTGGLAVAAVGTVSLIVALMGGTRVTLGGLGAGILFVAPVTLFLPLGASQRLEHPARHLLRLAIVASPAAYALVVGPFGPVMWTNPRLLLAPWAVVTIFVGLLGWPIGYRLADSDGEQRGRTVTEPVEHAG